MTRSPRRPLAALGAALHGPGAMAARLLGLEGVLIASLMLAAALTSTPTQAAPTLPSGFRDTLVTAVDSPTDITFTPGGRLVVSTQGGVLYLYTGGQLVRALDLSGKVCSDFERGMLGVAFDPLFSSNHYVYVYYTYAKYGGCPANTSQSPVNRVSRFLMSGNSVDPGSETVLIDNMPSPNGNHNGGDLLFGKDGYLYVSIGDGGCEIGSPSECAGDNDNARKQNVLTGKVLRITRNGGIPSGNPFTGTDSGRCNANGKTSAAKCRETYLWGLRNPFRLAADPNASGTKIYVNDVGQATWEEIDQAVAGSDYGWNIREGHCANGSTSDCSAPPSGMRNPIYDYSHANGCASITGGAFVPNGLWGSTYDGSYLYADYVCGRIFRLKGGTSSAFASNLGAITVLQFGPYGSEQALYYATYSNGGEIHRISTNRKPIAVAKADPTYGLTPLTVQFDGSASSDPDGGNLSYRWDFGDGSPIATEEKPTHTFQNVGVYTVQLTVSDASGAAAETTIEIDAGNTPPTPTIQSPAATDRFSVAQSISLEGSATDAQGNTPITYKWDVKLRHGTHDHPYFTSPQQTATFTTPAPEDLAAAGNSYLVVSLTATDSTGLSATRTVNLQPRKVQVTVASDPSGLGVTIEGQRFTAPATVTTWAGNPLDLAAPNQVASTGEPLVWRSWSVAGGQSFQYVAPTTDSTVTAAFALAPGPAFPAISDARVKENAPTSNEGAVTGLTTKGGSTSDAETLMRFSVSGVSGEIQSATLYLYAYDGSEDGPAIYPTSAAWRESTVTWNTRPAPTGDALDDVGAVPAKTWFTLDVTTAITGDGTYSFLLRQSSTDALSFRSRESSSGQPRLVVVMAGGGDVTAPATPTGLVASAPGSNRIDLTWNVASDDTAVTGYDVFRDGKFLTSTAKTTFADTSVVPTTTYSYRVRARDAAGNVSALTAPTQITTPRQTQQFVFTPSGDTYVQATTPSTSYGSKSTLRVDTDPATETYVWFRVSNLPGSVYRVKLRFFVPNVDGYGTDNGPKVYATASGWTELSLNWNNRPIRVNPNVLADAGAVGEGVWLEYDLTDSIGTAGNYGFVLAGDSANVLVLSSREGATTPQLVVTVQLDGAASAALDEPAPAPSPTAVPTEAASPTATPVIPFAEDFESGKATRWTAGDGFAVTDREPHGGTYAAVVHADGTEATIDASATLQLGGDERELYVAGWLALDRAPERETRVLTLLSAPDRPLISLAVDNDEQLGILDERSGRFTPVAQLERGDWHAVQFHVIAAGAGGAVELWLDGRLVVREAVALTDEPIAALRLGDPDARSAFVVRFDDLAVDRACIGTCPTDVVTPTPSATPTPQGSAPAPTEEPTATPEPTGSPTQEPTATPTPEPTEAPAETPTPEPQPTEASASGPTPAPSEDGA